MLYNKYIDNNNTLIPNEESVISDIQNVSSSAREEARQKTKAKYMDFIKDHECFFKAGQKADGVPFMYNMHKTTGISGGVGPMGSIKSRSVSIWSPRSKKAHAIHRIGFIYQSSVLHFWCSCIKTRFLTGSGIDY